ncbi:hypothetical protein FOA52_004414 [Chlamydomonas sp. UWO 241]|nr:hypothetical protein FOA52_004414 [Chlamydomonas sp. UWO 241]
MPPRNNSNNDGGGGGGVKPSAQSGGWGGGGAEDGERLAMTGRSSVAAASSPSATSAHAHASESMQMEDERSASLRVPAVSKPAADPNDPWAALQSKYANAQEAPPKGQYNSKLRNVTEDDDEVEMLLDGNMELGDLGAGRGRWRGGSSGKSGPAPQSPVQVQQPTGPRGGGWGNGDLAVNGTLMLGDTQPQSPARQTQQPLPSDYAPPKSRGGAGGGSSQPKAQSTEVMGFEDMEDMDVDAMIKQEMDDGGLNADLAAKLKRFEALDDEDY